MCHNMFPNLLTQLQYRFWQGIQNFNVPTTKQTLWNWKEIENKLMTRASISLEEKWQKEIQMCPGLKVIRYMSTSIYATTCPPASWLNFNIACDREYKWPKNYNVFLIMPHQKTKSSYLILTYEKTQAQMLTLYLPIDITCIEMRFH